MWVEFKKKDGEVIKVFIEIKPYVQTIKPEPLKPGAKLKEVNRYNREMKTFLTNQAKWRAANYEFKKRGCKFFIFTEKELSDKLHLF